MAADVRAVLREAAGDAHAVLHFAYSPLAELKPIQTQQNSVAVRLLYSSLEVARSACLLIKNDLDNSLFAAGILLRSQLDHQLRGMYFALCATPEDFQYFLKKDALPPQKDGRKLGPVALAKLLGAKLHDEEEHRQIFEAHVKSQWDELTSFAHGGLSMLDFYNGGIEIRPLEPHAGIIRIIIAVAVMPVYWMEAWRQLCGCEGVPPILQSTLAELDSFLFKWTPIADLLDEIAD